MFPRALLSLVAALALGGCSFAARSPEMYRDDTAHVLAARAPEIRACYAHVLATHPQARGRVVVDFDVEPKTGALSNVRVDPTRTTAPPEAARCVTDQLGGLTLTPPDRRLGLAAWTWELSPSGRAL